MIKRVLCAAAVACCAVPALAGDEAAKPEAPKEKLVCTYEATTGSHLKKRVCVPESEHRARRDRDQQRMRDMQTRQASPNTDQTP